MKKLLSPINTPLEGSVKIPPDKSIAQRSVIIASIANGTSIIENFPQAGDPQSTLKAMQTLGANIKKDNNNLIIEGGIDTLYSPDTVIDAGNSGTGFRLILGLLAGYPKDIFATLVGDSSLSKRPMKRITKPLISMGASIMGREQISRAPIAVQSTTLKGGPIHTEVASAQLKSALLLASLHADAPIALTEPSQSRNHTEIMLKSFGANIREENNTIYLEPSSLTGTNIQIPGDVSSAAFMMVAACIVPDSHIVLQQVGLNPTRTGVIQCLQQMGANITITQTSTDGEPIGDIEIKYSPLQAITIAGDIIPNVIDELPILALAASVAEGQTIIKDASELRVKESDRIEATVDTLKGLGANIQETPDGMVIDGLASTSLKPIRDTFDAKHDHRIAMTTAIASLICTDSITLDGAEWADISFPNFYEVLASLNN